MKFSTNLMAEEIQDLVTEYAALLNPRCHYNIRYCDTADAAQEVLEKLEGRLAEANRDMSVWFYHEPVQNGHHTSLTGKLIRTATRLIWRRQ